MNVELLYHTPDPERAIACAAHLCYASVGAADLLETMEEEKIHRVLSVILKRKHYSTLEHVCYTFAIEGISRACSHELVRHRIASYSQQSQRYVKFKDAVPTVKPETIANNPAFSERYDQLLSEVSALYKEMIEGGIPCEDARFVLTNATETKIVVTMNIRSLFNFFSLRCDKNAQWEIRQLANMMFDLVEPTAPFIFAHAKRSYED